MVRKYQRKTVLAFKLMELGVPRLGVLVGSIQVEPLSRRHSSFNYYFKGSDLEVRRAAIQREGVQVT